MCVCVCVCVIVSVRRWSWPTTPPFNLLGMLLNKYIQPVMGQLQAPFDRFASPRVAAVLPLVLVLAMAPAPSLALRAGEFTPSASWLSLFHARRTLLTCHQAAIPFSLSFHTRKLGVERN